MEPIIRINRFCRILFCQSMAMFAGIVSPITSQAQTLAIGQMDLDGSVRNLQLMGKFDPSYSFTSRPVYYNAFAKYTGSKNGADALLKLIDSNTAFVLQKEIYRNKNFNIALRPVELVAKFNSHHPYGWNDEGMIAAKGLQTQISAGLVASVGFLSIQLQPQFVYSANPTFENNAAYGFPSNGALTQVLPGQSSIRLNFGAVSLGYSTENVWWGPGQFSSLLLSNNAPGFSHFTFNTVRPIKTGIGSFEFQLILGRLDEDSAANLPYEHLQLKPAVLRNDWRYLNALEFTYQPSFLPGVFVGLTRSFQVYSKDLSGSFIQKYVPVFTSLFKNSTENEDAKGRDQAISIFSRVLFPNNHAEFYVEYGWNDHSANSRDLLINPQHSAAYIVGGKKLIPLRKNKWLELAGEITQMAQSVDYVVRDAGNWYEHSIVKQGMTNRNQILGAGSGLGNNVQTLTTTWVDGIKRLGIILQRIQHDPTAIAGTFANIGLRDREWDEIAFGIQTRWDFKKVLVGFELQHAWSENYAWQAGLNAGNLYSLLKIAYTW